MPKKNIKSFKIILLDLTSVLNYVTMHDSFISKNDILALKPRKLFFKNLINSKLVEQLLFYHFFPVNLVKSNLSSRLPLEHRHYHFIIFKSYLNVFSGKC